ncbi:hypothetical protein BKA70DRAFT_1263566 [Coprinopsis sp. MPI-PUGE-AT-0042]|nr:hypothetical protein BKA70DRAFT_1263566 [Coprinopsis sp. MPI-PUGE-AT-0042]
MSCPMTLLGLEVARALPVPHLLPLHSHCPARSASIRAPRSIVDASRQTRRGIDPRSLPRHRFSTSESMVLRTTRRSKRATQLRQSLIWIMAPDGPLAHVKDTTWRVVLDPSVPSPSSGESPRGSN